MTVIAQVAEIENGALPSLSTSVSPEAIIQPVGVTSVDTVITVVPEAEFSAIDPVWLSAMVINRFSEVSSRAAALALPLSTIWLATSSNASPPARNRARFLRSFVVTVFLFSRLSVESGMAATMFGSTSILHLEGCGNHPIGWGGLCRADNQI